MRVIRGVLGVEDPVQMLVRLVVTAGAERRGSAGELDQGQQRRQAPHQHDPPAGQDRLDKLSAGRP